MPKFTYVGDEPSVYVFGLSFPKGEPVEVTDAHALKKLANHPHFMPAPTVLPVPSVDVLPVEAPEIGAALTPPAAPRRRTKKGTANG